MKSSIFFLAMWLSAAGGFAAEANRHTHLDQSDPWTPGLRFPKLTTPQWVGEQGVEAVVTLGIDDMRGHDRWEKFLRPIIEHFQKLQGKAPISIFTCEVNPAETHLQKWLKEGLSFETHTFDHPCPILAEGNIEKARGTYEKCVDLLSKIPGGKPVAFRVPCCDVYNTPSPRFYEEIFARVSPEGNYMEMDSSVFNVFTEEDPELPRDLVIDEQGRERFLKYDAQAYECVNRIYNYPYPYIISKVCWQFPCAQPSDSLAQRFHQPYHPQTVRDWQAAIDATVVKKGVFNLCFHPHNWIKPEQIIELIDYAVQKHGSKVRFLTFKEANDRIKKYLLEGQALRDTAGRENGVRLLDLNADGYMDVVMGNEQKQVTKLWVPESGMWQVSDFPLRLAGKEGPIAGIQFGVSPNNRTIVYYRGENGGGIWEFNGTQWEPRKELLAGLELEGKPVLTSRNGKDEGVRFRDVDNDNACEILVSNPRSGHIFSWSTENHAWLQKPYGMPKWGSIVNEEGLDNGLRFVDINGDGYNDIIFSNEERYGVFLFLIKELRAYPVGFTRAVMLGKRGDEGEVPPIVRAGKYRNNGAWFARGEMWVQNEDTDKLPNNVQRRTFKELTLGLLPPPLPPEESLRQIEVVEPFTVELVAAEPLVQDPISFEWGEDGRLWVIQMRDYPDGVDEKGTPGGVLSVLEDIDKDGKYDKSTPFMEGLNFPSGVFPWRNGVLVSAAPEVFYAEDTDGDGKADLKKTILKGFNEHNTQHRVNGFQYGLDNWLYLANGHSGGEIKSLVSGKELSLGMHDLKFQPDTGDFQLEAGTTEFGRNRDDWGNWFGNTHADWGWHFFLPIRYAARNPHLAVGAPRQDIARYPGSSLIHRISRLMHRPQVAREIGHVTAPCSLMPYRDNLFGPDFVDNVFICEVDKNVIRRQILVPDGVSFNSKPAPGEENREFLASKDNWFRPTMVKTGPDGALYISDMYRLIIEHKEYYPADLHHILDFRAGHDKGRIYRVYPKGAKLRPIPSLKGYTTPQLVAAMDSENGWQRDTVQRLLVQKQDASAIPLLAKMAETSPNPKVRLQALCTLDGLGGSIHVLKRALHDEHPFVRIHALRISERLAHVSNNEDLLDNLLRLATDKDVKVRYQLAFTLGEWKSNPRVADALITISDSAPDDENMQEAVLSSALPHLEGMLQKLLGRKLQNSLVGELIRFAVSERNTRAIAHVFHFVGGTKLLTPDRFEFLKEFISRCQEEGLSVEKVIGQDTELQDGWKRLTWVFDNARRTATGTGSSEIRVSAVGLLGKESGKIAEDIELLRMLLNPEVDLRIQEAALDALEDIADGRAGEVLIEKLNILPPSGRETAFKTILTRTVSARKLLEKIDASEIPNSQIPPQVQQKLRNHSDPEIKKLAESVYGKINSDRLGVLKQFAKVSELSGVPEKGAELFKANCAQCHRVRGMGVQVGPDLSGISEKPVDQLLASILDPNQSVDPTFLQYSVMTKADKEFTGIISSETPTSIFIRMPGGLEETVLRKDLKEFRSLTVSLMPAGIESGMTPQDLADLISFLKVGELQLSQGR